MLLGYHKTPTFTVVVIPGTPTGTQPSRVIAPSKMHGTGDAWSTSPAL
jgi:hypothetical protein